jgi:hypothetical protein
MEDAMILLLAVACLQVGPPPEESIAKRSAAAYRAALNKYEQAKAALEKGEATKAFDLAGEICTNTEIQKRECRLKIEEGDGGWLRGDFFPVYVRCAAAAALARQQASAGKKADALARVQAASKEIPESVRNRVPGAAALQKEIEGLITEFAPRAQAGDVERAVTAAMKAHQDGRLEDALRLYREALKLDPGCTEARDGVARVEADQRRQDRARRAADFTTAHAGLLKGGRFRSALAMLDAADAPLEEAALADLRTATRAASNRFRDDAFERFAERIGAVDSMAALLAREFTVPADDELVESHPAFAWCRKFAAAADELKRLGRDADADKVAGIVRGLWAGSLALAGDEFNPWFAACEAVVSDVIVRRLAVLAARSRSGDPLDALVREAESLLKTLEGLDEIVGERSRAWREANARWAEHRKAARETRARFAVEPPEIDSASRALAEATDADALGKVTRGLRAIERATGNDLTPAARRRLWTLLVIARALELLRDGRTCGDAAALLGDEAAELRAAGGAIPGEPARYGPKVEKVLAALK